MKKGNCIECDKPLFDQNKDEFGDFCDECNELLTGGIDEEIK